MGLRAPGKCFVCGTEGLVWDWDRGDVCGLHCAYEQGRRDVERLQVAADAAESAGADEAAAVVRRLPELERKVDAILQKLTPPEPVTSSVTITTNTSGLSADDFALAVANAARRTGGYR